MAIIKGSKLSKSSVLEAEKQLRYLSSQIIAAQEIERKRISRELHDELGQALSLIKFKLRFIRNHLHANQGPLKQECEDTLEFIDQVIENVRRLSRDLSPTVLDDLGLTAAIRWLLHNVTMKEKNIHVISDIINIDHFFPRDSYINIYRIIQEALTNIGEHAEAKNVSVRIMKRKDTILFFIEDDGIGFDVKKALKKITIERGLGLASMAERAQMLGGSFTILSKKGRGTRIQISIPFNKKAQNESL